MPRTEQANRRIREEQRSKILEAAKKVFARKGMAATMDDVAAEASISHGLAYRYFANKEAIVRALVEQAIQQSPPLERVLEMPGTPGERLESLISGFVESRRRQSDFYQLLDHVLYDEAMPYDFRELLHRRGQVMQDVLRRLIVEGQASGEVADGNPDQLVTALLASLDGLVRWAGRHPDPRDEHYPDARILLRMLKPSGRNA